MKNHSNLHDVNEYEYFRLLYLWNIQRTILALRCMIWTEHPRHSVYRLPRRHCYVCHRIHTSQGCALQILCLLIDMLLQQTVNSRNYLHGSSTVITSLARQTDSRCVHNLRELCNTVYTFIGLNLIYWCYYILKLHSKIVHLLNTNILWTIMSNIVHLLQTNIMWTNMSKIVHLLKTNASVYYLLLSSTVHNCFI